MSSTRTLGMPFMNFFQFLAAVERYVQAELRPHEEQIGIVIILA